MIFSVDIVTEEYEQNVFRDLDDLIFQYNWISVPFAFCGSNKTSHA